MKRRNSFDIYRLGNDSERSSNYSQPRVLFEAEGFSLSEAQHCALVLFNEFLFPAHQQQLLVKQGKLDCSGVGGEALHRKFNDVIDAFEHCLQDVNKGTTCW